MHEVRNIKNELERLLKPSRDQSPPNLLKDIFQLAAEIGEAGADALLNAHPDLFKYSPLLTQAYHRTVIGKEIAEIGRIANLDLAGSKPFKAVASEPSMVTYNRVGEMFDVIDFSDCRRLVMVGCGRLPAAMFHVHDRTDIPEIVGLDNLPEAVAAARDLLARLGYTRARVELCHGQSYDYAGAQIVLIANMVSPKAGVVSRVADSATPDVRIVVRDPLSLGRLWSDSVERMLDPRLEVIGRGEGSGHWSLSRDLYLQRRSPAASTRVVTPQYKAGRAGDLAVLAAVRWWGRVRYPRLCSRTFRRSRELPDPAIPTSDVDKFLWRKIFDRNPLFTTACDKLAAKEYALSTCPELKTARVLWVGTDPRLIPNDVLSGTVVIKANHGSRWNWMVHAGAVDRQEMYKQASSWVGRTYGRAFNEWGYRHAVHCLLVEEMLLEHGERIATEYKFHVSGGQTAYVMVAQRDEHGQTHNYYFDRHGQPSQAPSEDGLPTVTLPSCFGRMCETAESLAKPFDYIRVDLYAVSGEIFFSELTAYPLSGQGGSSLRLRAVRNAMWDLRKSWFLTTPQSGWRRVYAEAFRRWLDDDERQRALSRRKAVGLC